MELYEALKNGTSKEDLIKAFTEELNAATARLEEDRAAEQEKQKKEEEIAAARVKATEALEDYYNLLGIDAKIDLSEALNLDSLNTMFKELGKVWRRTKPTSASDEDIISKFIRSL